MSSHILAPSVFEPSVTPPVSPLYPISPLKKSALRHPKMTHRFSQAVDYVRTHVNQAASYNFMQGPKHVTPHIADSGVTQSTASLTQTSNKKQSNSTEWIWASVLAAAAYGTSSFLIYVLNRRTGRFNSAAMNLAVYVIVCVLSLGLMGLSANKTIGTEKGSIFANLNSDIKGIFTSPKFIAYALAIAATTVIGNIALYASYRLAPNPGFCDVVSSSSAFVALLLGIVLFGQKAKAINVGGMALLMVAGYLILA
jgi:drug/metabolite transporter (DMT)-like permease